LIKTLTFHDPCQQTGIGHILTIICTRLFTKVNSYDARSPLKFDNTATGTQESQEYICPTRFKCCKEKQVADQIEKKTHIQRCGQNTLNMRKKKLYCKRVLPAEEE
jgi:hypothetical protein